MTSERDKRQSGELIKQLIDAKRELRELEQLKAEKAAFDHDLDKALNWPKDEPVKWGYAYNEKTNRIRRVPKKARRPTRWMGRDGYDFVYDILAIQALDNKCSVAKAIRQLKKTNPARWPEKQRNLERRFQEAKHYWEPWCRCEANLEARLQALLVKTDLLAKLEM